MRGIDINRSDSIRITRHKPRQRGREYLRAALKGRHVGYYVTVLRVKMLRFICCMTSSYVKTVCKNDNCKFQLVNTVATGVTHIKLYRTIACSSSLMKSKSVTNCSQGVK
jgi:hypothetical protein